MGPSLLSPARLPGITRESNDALVKILKDDYRRWHCFFNDEGMHNHASHHMVAIHAMGASAPLLEAAYQTHVVYMRPAFSSPGSINEGNFHAYLGDEKYYTAYLEFFTAKLLADGVSSTLDKYIFSRSANVGSGDVEPPFMLARFHATVFHPMIHAGNGVEFGFLGLVAEGLAQTAIHPPHLAGLYPLSMWDETGQSDKADEQPVKGGTHAFTILARILNDARFSPSAIGLPIPDGEHDHELTRTERVVGDLIVKYVEQWTVDGGDARDVARKIEELSWVNVLFYGVGGWGGRATSETGKFKADFFLMHLITSLLFVPSYVAQLSHRSRIILLRSYFATCVAWYVARGRPALPIRVFYAAVTPTPVEHGAPHATPAKGTLVPENPSPNPWLPLLQSAMVHPDDHLCKLQRALVHFAALYGARPAGHFAAFASSAPALEGAEALDGTLFVRVAGLTADRLGWMREGQDDMGWDRRGFFF
ncbi:hypothetical protein CERSUDRAFT_52660 [Gelatoporia subvermispora B]|uniref:Oxidoreductase AflY n=1 Tax=Ceriporiopsis subvermispora (strain B) TaxID=914234 RepID=M2QFU4_CERS8|nr:hypothetical protein CERSUDRAFT_52660 [Gelatoporia subvermispora B]